MNEEVKVVYDSGQDGTRAIIGRVKIVDDFVEVERPDGVVRILKSRIFYMAPATWGGGRR